MRTFARYLFTSLCVVGDLVWSDSQVRQDFGYAPSIHATGWRYIILTAPMHINFTN